MHHYGIHKLMKEFFNFWFELFRCKVVFIAFYKYIYYVSEASICWVSVQFCEVFLLKIKILFVFFILKCKTFSWYCECTQIKLFAASNDVYSYIYEEKLRRILIFHLLRKKMQVILLAPPCPSKRLQLPLLAQTIVYLSHIYLKFLNVYCAMH